MNQKEWNMLEKSIRSLSDNELKQLQDMILKERLIKTPFGECKETAEEIIKEVTK